MTKMTTSIEEHYRNQARKQLKQHGIKSGTVLIGDTIIVHNYNETGKKFECDWSGNVLFENEPSDPRFHKNAPGKRVYQADPHYC